MCLLASNGDGQLHGGGGSPSGLQTRIAFRYSLVIQSPAPGRLTWMHTTHAIQANAMQSMGSDASKAENASEQAPPDSAAAAAVAAATAAAALGDLAAALSTQYQVNCWSSFL